MRVKFLTGPAFLLIMYTTRGYSAVSRRDSHSDLADQLDRMISRGGTVNRENRVGVVLRRENWFLGLIVGHLFPRPPVSPDVLNAA